jgi:flagellar motor switch protein FliM
VSGILSEERVAALVEAAKEGQPEQASGGGSGRSRRVREIDFSRPTKFSQDQQRRVAREHESFCRSVATRLSAELRAPIELEVLHVTQLTWLSALAEIPQPSVYAVLLTDPLATRMLLSAELGAVRRLIARLLGGLDPGRPEERGLTEIELALARRLFAVLVSGLSLSWQDLLGLRLSIETLETQQHSIQLAPPSEPSLVVTVELRDQGSSSTLSLVVPYLAIEPVAARLQGALHYNETSLAAQADPAVAAALRSSLAAVEVELRAEIAALEIPLGRALALAEGDVIRLGRPAERGVSVAVGGLVLYRGRPGRVGKRRALLVLDTLEEAP